VHVPGIRKTSIRAIYRETVVLAQREAHRPLKPSEVSRHYARKAVAFMRSEPAAAAKLMVYKLAYFWTNREILNNKHIYFLTDRYTPIVRWLPLSFWIVGPLGLMGLAACRGRGWELFPLWGFVVVYMFSVVLFFVVSRFRVPVLPVLMLLGAYGVASLVAAFRGRQWLRASVLVLVAGGGALLAAQTPPSNIDRPEVVLVGLARAELESGNPLGSLALLEEAISYNPTYIKAHLSLGLVQQRLGDTDEALATYERAVALAPRSVPARTGLARLLTEQGDYAEAIDQLRALADRTRRMNVDALAALASAYAEAGQFDRAVETAQEALRLARRQRRARKVDALKRQLADYRASRLPASPVTEPEIDAESKTDQYR